MKTHRISVMLVTMLMLSCGGSDDGPIGPVIGGPSNGDTGDTGGDTTDPLLYDATEKLADVAEFPIGNIVSANRLASNSTDDQTFKTILNNEYNSITAENDMKMASMFDGPGVYDYSAGDAIVAYAKANAFRVHGHVLAWQNQQPGWFQTFAGSNEEFETAVMAYITNTVEHFAQEKMMVNGQEVSVVSGWDVVNEAFESGAASNVLYQKIDDFKAKCFLAARAGDPDVKLFYNDFNIAGDPGKRSDIVAMVTDFQTRNIPIDGIGLQMHLNHDWPNTDLPLAVQEIADTGLLVHVSELDVKANYNNDISELTEVRAGLQEDQYQRAVYYYTTSVPAAQQYGITIWGLRDQDSWLYDNGGDWPLLYNNEFKTKISHRGFVVGLKGVAVQ